MRNRSDSIRGSIHLELCAQAIHHEFGHQLGDALAVTRHFLDQSRGAEEQFRIREQKNRLDVGSHQLVHRRHLQFIVEVGERAAT